MADPVIAAKIALALSDEDNRKRLGWAVAIVLAPVIVVVALLCVLGSGAVSHNISADQLCFQSGELPADIPAEYRVCIEQTRQNFAELDEIIAEIQSNMDEGNSLDPTRVKAVFFSLYFGDEAPPLSRFAHCFAASEIRTETVIEQDEAGNDVEVEQTYTVFLPIEDMATVYTNLTTSLGVEIAEEQKSNADSVYSLIKNGYPSVAAGGSGFEGADMPYVSASGFCSPVGANWRSIVTSEFGGRIDPITGRRDGHTGMDLAVPTGTPVRAALPGTVRVAKYDSSYGYYVTIGHADGLLTLYGHNSRLLVTPGQTVQAGDVISLSGSTGRSTGPHLHFEVRLNGQRTNPIYHRRMKMKIRAEMNRRHAPLPPSEYQVDKVVEVPDEQFVAFLMRPQDRYEFIRSSEVEPYQGTGHDHCLLVLSHRRTDGVLVQCGGDGRAMSIAYVARAWDVVQARLDRVADFIVGQGTQRTASGSWYVYCEELDEKFGVAIQEGNGFDDILKEELERRPEVAQVDISLQHIETTSLSGDSPPMPPSGWRGLNSTGWAILTASPKPVTNGSAASSGGWRRCATKIPPRSSSPPSGGWRTPMARPPWRCFPPPTKST